MPVERGSDAQGAGIMEGLNLIRGKVAAEQHNKSSAHKANENGNGSKEAFEETLHQDNGTESSKP